MSSSPPTAPSRHPPVAMLLYDVVLHVVSRFIEHSQAGLRLGPRFVRQLLLQRQQQHARQRHRAVVPNEILRDIERSERPIS